MLSGKELLISIIKPALSTLDNNQIQQIAFDNAELNTFLNNFNHPEDIINLTESALNNLVNNLEPLEARNYFLGNIKFIKGLAELAKQNQTKLNLNKNQLLNLEELKELIKLTISRNEYNIQNAKEKSENQISDYRKILGIVQKEELFTENDYNIIEKIVRSETPNDVDNNLDKIYSFVNEFNARKLSEIYTGIKEKQYIKPNITINLTPIKLIEEPEEVIVTERIIEDYNKEEAIEEIEVTPLNFEDTDPFQDIFSSINLRKKKPSTKLVDAEHTQKLKEILSYLGYNYDILEDELKLKLTSEDLTKMEEFAKYLKEENKVILSKIKTNNIYSLIFILTKSSKQRIELILSTLYNYFGIKSAGGELFKIVNNATTIFSEQGCQNFVENAKIFKQYNVLINNIIDKNINFLHIDNEELLFNIDLLINYGADISILIDKCNLSLYTHNSFNSFSSLIKKNLDVLKQYCFDLKLFFEEKNSCYTILNSVDLASKIDQFIEVGLNEFIHSNSKNSGNILKTLIIKRIYYAYKNKMPVWENINIEYKRLKDCNFGDEDSRLTFQEFNQLKKYIKDEDSIINESEINMIKSDYSIMELIDEGNRPAIYSNSPLTLIKRKLELIFDTQIISRPKAFRVFKLLMADGFNEKQALLYALVYNSILEENEFIFIKNLVERMGVEKKDDELFRAV
ncbi:MAG: hypothetical protein PHH51_02585 [Bacilli bacterium]|nr:hypothetical protein [Bacilli bacterium]MDD3895548.1 hypothetical protein [Bacilli bacterium]MDD4407813.1 hypothetical protein [Bacilli bacterium]